MGRRILVICDQGCQQEVAGLPAQVVRVERVANQYHSTHIAATVALVTAVGVATLLDAHVVAEGTTENVGPEGTLVHLPRQLPQVGSRVRLEVLNESGEKLQVIEEVLRIERNPAHPQAALQLVGETDEWRGVVWHEAMIKMNEADYELDEDEL